MALCSQLTLQSTITFFAANPTSLRIFVSEKRKRRDCQYISLMAGKRSRSSGGSQKEERNGHDEVTNQKGEGEDIVKQFLSEEANKHVRNKYRELMVDMQEQDEDLDPKDLHKLQLLVLRANEAFDLVKRPREAALDAHLLKTCGIRAKLKIESSQSNLTEFKPLEFAQKLKEFAMQENDFEESEEEDNRSTVVRFGRAASSVFRSVVGVEPLFSAVEWERPEPSRKVREKRAALPDSQAVKPLEVVSSAGNEEREAEAVSWMCKILKHSYVNNGNKPLCFFKFIVNPKSYSKTVENLFHTSLLVREQYAEIYEDKDGLPVICPVQSSSNNRQGIQDSQCIFCISVEEWKEIVKSFKITSAMIPPTRNSLKRK